MLVLDQIWCNDENGDGRSWNDVWQVLNYDAKEASQLSHLRHVHDNGLELLKSIKVTRRIVVNFDSATPTTSSVRYLSP